MNTVRKFSESYPGEAWECKCEAYQADVERAAGWLAYDYSCDPSRLARDAEGCDINADTVATLVAHIVELRKLIAKESQAEAIRNFDRALRDDSFVQAIAESEVGELE